MDFHTAMETFAEAWVAANSGQQVGLTLRCWQQPSNAANFIATYWLYCNELLLIA